MYRAEEDYLKIIYKLNIEEKKDFVKTANIAEETGNANPTVNEMVKRLAAKKMIKFIRYKGVYLTDKGLFEAKRLVRNHRLWEVFLSEKLNFSWELVHDEAERLEHASSNELMDRIDNFLNEPDYCSHGNAIPKRNGFVPPLCNQSLKSLQKGAHMIVKRVFDEPSFLSFMNENDIKIGSQIKVLEKDDFSGIIKTLIDGREQMFSSDIASKIYGD